MNKVVFLSALVVIACVCIASTNADGAKKKSFDEQAIELNHKLMNLQKRVARRPMSSRTDPDLLKLYNEFDLAIETLKRTGAI